MKALRNAIPKNLDANFQKELANQISFVGSPTLLDRLLQLYDIHREVLSPLFPDREKDMKELKDVRNYLTHYGQHKTLTPNFPC